MMSINNIGDAKKEYVSVASSAGDLIGSNEDLLRNILIYFDKDKSLCRSKLVSKLWHSIICDPGFKMAWRTKHVQSTPSGLLMVIYLQLVREHYKPPKFIEFDECEESSPSPNFDLNSLPFKRDDGEYESLIKVLQYSNGLLLVTRCRLHDPDMIMKELAVFNPTTNQFKLIPEISKNQGRRSEAMLAFDPYKSHHYKIIMIMVSNMHVYESRSDSWSLHPLGKEYNTSLELGVYWNEGIHWINRKNNFYFDIKNLCFKEMPKIPCRWNIWYFGESRGHLLLIQPLSLSGPLHYDIFEMELDRSKWVVKYNVDLTTLRAEFPARGFGFLSCIIGRDQGKDSVELILRFIAPRKYTYAQLSNILHGEYQINTIISYNLQTKKVKNLGRLLGNENYNYKGRFPFMRLLGIVL